jgi:hypothetical protein
MFNDMLEQFMTELNMTFPENNSVKRYQASMELLKLTNPKQLSINFLNVAKPFSNQIMSKDENFILKEPILPDVNLGEMWLELSPKSKDNIWKYLQSLLTIGTMVNSIPKNLMDNIEKMAESIASEMTEAPDMSALMSLLQKQA